MVIDLRINDSMLIYIFDALTYQVIRFKCKNDICINQRVMQTEYAKHEIQSSLGYDTNNIDMYDVNNHLHIYNLIRSRGLILVKGISDDVRLLC